MTKLKQLEAHLTECNRLISELVEPQKPRRSKDLYVKQHWSEAAKKQFQKSHASNKVTLKSG